MEYTTPIPYVIDLAHLRIEELIAFILGMIFAVTINAEAQAFMATLAGDQRLQPKNRFHFNYFLHLDVLGTVAFLLAGFGWPRAVDIDPAKFPHPKLYTFLTRLAGPIANLFLAGIAASIIRILMAIMELHPQIFYGVIAVNVTVAVYNLIPIPPLAAGTILTDLIPDKLMVVKQWIMRLGPWLLIAILLFDRINNLALFSRFLNPLVVAVSTFIKGGF
jgi:Zn-dependent protease